MRNYGHDLRFGSFLSPASQRPDQAVELAVLCEQLGLDLVTFQDHPYSPQQLDTWTLMSFVAARTGRVRLAANVTNLPLRPPAVLARSVASLDRLSGGRIELGLGAGAFWDAIEAMGGRRLTPRQAVQALEEAVAVIRELWDVQASGVVRVEGTFSRVIGAKRGPAPLHDVEIWIGAYKPRMLSLTGRIADGWLPSLGYLQPTDLGPGNDRIDDAAEAAGRSPQDIRRLLNITPPQGPAGPWIEELAELALEEGVSTFILGTDDPEQLRRFAGEVAPAVRELVEAERAMAAQPVEPGAAAAARTVPGSAFSVTPTPDDGVRLSGVRVWDESTRPTGPAPDPERQYTPHELATGKHLIDVHDMLRRELTQVQELIERVAAGTVDVGTARSHINTMTLRQNKWTLGTYCESYCRVVTTHHTLEDQGLFPHLRSSDPRLTPVLDRLVEEHHLIHDVLEGVDRALVGFVAVPDGTAELRAAVDLLRDTLLSHLAYEERELVEPLARLGMA